MKQPKNRSDLKFQSSNYPEPAQIDYSDEITEKELKTMQSAMPQEALDDEGVLVSGDRW